MPSRRRREHHNKGHDTSRSGKLPTVRARTRRSARAVMVRFGFVLALLGALGVGGVWWLKQKNGPPSPVRLAHPEKVDPELAEMISQRLASAEEKPLEAERHANLAYAYEANGLWSEARTCYENAVRLAPMDPTWRLHAAIARQMTGDLAGATSDLRALASAHPEIPAIQHRLGDVLLDAGALDAAMAAFERAAVGAPSAPEPLVGLGDVKLRQNKYAEAASILERARTLDPSYRVTNYLLGLAYRGLGRREDAQREMTLGADAKKRFLPDRASQEIAASVVGYHSRLARADALEAAGHLSDAATLLEQALALRPDDVTTVNNLSVVYQNMGRPQQALDLLERAERLDPNQFATEINIVECLLALNRAAEAVPHGEKAVTLAPNLGQAHFAKARALHRAGRFSEARPALQATLALDTRNPETYLLLGDACARLGLMSEAKEHLSIAAKRMPTSIEAHLNLGMVCRALGLLDEARLALEAARRLAPEDARVLAFADRLGR